MNKCNCEERKIVNRKEFRYFMVDTNSKSKCDLYKRVNNRKINKNDTSGFNGEKGRHRSSLVSRNCVCCNNEVRNNNNNNKNNADDDNDDGEDSDKDNLIRIENTCHFLISCELYKEFLENFLIGILKLGSFQEKWESFD
eukprot:Pgem_evm1s2701